MPQSSIMKNSWILSLKLLLISVGVIWVTVTTKLAAPMMFKFAWNDLPAIWSVIVSWMEPPYLYLIINGIIITIVASTRFQSNHHHDNKSQHQVISFSYNPPNALPQYSGLTSHLPPVSSHMSFGVIEPQIVSHGIESSATAEPRSKHPYIMDVKTVRGSEVVRGIEGDFIESESRSIWNTSQSVVNSPPVPEFSFPVRKKRLANSRFIHNGKVTKLTSSEGTRGIRKPKKHETLDNTWKIIADGRQPTLPSTRNFRRSDTFLFQNLHCESRSDDSTAKTKVVRKSETFKDRTSFQNENQYRQPSSPESVVKLKKELALSEDELTRRVKAFIKKFNEHIRLERQKSLEK